MTVRRAAVCFWCAALLTCAARAEAQQTSAPTLRETLLMPFHNPQADRRLYWLAEGSTVLLADYFEVFGAASITREARVAAFERLQLPPVPSLSHATVIKVAQFVGASDVVIGSYEVAGTVLTVHARVIRLDTGRLMPEVTERGPLENLFSIYERVARRLRDATNAMPTSMVVISRFDGWKPR